MKVEESRELAKRDGHGVEPFGAQIWAQPGFLLPGFEPGMLDSKSRVMTTSLQETAILCRLNGFQNI